ncbi:WASH complex subunit 7 [Folsomia candida]|uniref:WASH complex subunit 7 n=1 Tax=Folsomia candida TaxID=158441 RepID=A0A226D466_FOLCA|nr:WASH complex subunit 7 [Folsomia candida]
MFGSRRSSKLQRYPSADYEFHPGSDFELILTKSEFRPGEMVTFQVNARNGNAVRLNLYTQLMQTAVFLQRGKFSAEKTEVGSILSTRVESVKLIRDEMPIKIVPWEVDNGVAQIYQSPIVATTIVATTGGSCNESRNLFPQAVPFNRSLLTTEFDNLPPHYSMLSLRSPFSGSSETHVAPDGISE